MFPFRPRILAKESFKTKVLASPYLTANGRKAAERLMFDDAISIERLLNEIGQLHAALEQLRNTSGRKAIGL